MQNRQNEAGFTLIGMLIAVGIVAILAMIAVPKFTSAIASANTAKIQSDLSTLNTAIAVYEIDNGKAPDNITDLADYLQSTDIKPPKGDCYVEGKTVKLEATTYTIDTANSQALCNGKAIGAFYKEKKTASNDGGDGQDGTGSGTKP
uniref:competence type IV pilus major pilin ComGC n=1 Tax=Mitsuokella multacida TaxID=52226 RepID=UPI0040282776